jgi:ribosomal protein L11 methyltransferase
MRWTELRITVLPEYAEPVTHLFTKHGEGGAVVELPAGHNPDEGESPPAGAPVTLKTYIPVDPTAKSRRAMIDVGLRLISYICPLPSLEEREVDDSEWRNQRFDPIRVGRRLVIAPPGSEAQLRPGDIAIPLEPGLAFGTGHHPTTAMVLAAMEDAPLEGAQVLDAGCGSGILSIAALKLGARRVVAVDVEEDAVRSSRQNLQRAGLLNRAEIIHAALPDGRIPPASFDFVLANISANVLIKIAPHLLAALKPNGAIIASGVLEERYAAVKSAFEAIGGCVSDKKLTGDWACFQVRAGK